ncbi:hypothetical protein [Acetobacter sp. DsW_063]|nr:hypothetical protein [Acetobacter sp. DsW_063]
MSKSVKRFSPTVRARAVRLALEHEGEHGGEPICKVLQIVQ